MKQIYVSPSGFDENDGTRANPFLTVYHALSVGKENADIILSDGVYHEYKPWHISGMRRRPSPVSVKPLASVFTYAPSCY